MARARITCCVPRCFRSRRFSDLEASEWICDAHWSAIPDEARIEYDHAWREADKADKRLSAGFDTSLGPYTRVTNAWERCKALAGAETAMSADPYLIHGPALISFSGGRTSAFMLYQILQAHGGTLPDDVVVAFANTGKEREETLRYVHECGSRWGVRIYWVEFAENEAGFELVGLNSASRKGEPFAAVIRSKSFLPNAVTRFCTTKLKVEPMKKLMLSLGHERWLNAVGLRYDEGSRVLKQLARNEQGKERWTSVMPVSKARHVKADVMRFWLGDNTDPLDLKHPLPQGFDLGLRSYEGNCDLCFLKSRAKLLQIMREHPDSAAWWIGQEAAVTPDKPSGARFVTEYSYRELAAYAANSPSLPGIMDDYDDHDAECGLYCAGEAA